MRALILNSGLGNRIGRYTQDSPKCMIEIYNNETILGRQLRLLAAAGITQVVITTGAFADKLVQHCKSLCLPLQYDFVYNERYAETNYIYSIYCARKWLENDDIILMHGDLVFEAQLLDRLMDYQGSCMAVSKDMALPEKDFKAVVKNGSITKIGIEFFEDAVAAQPLYKLDRQTWRIWLDKICEFCEQGQTKCYAEKAFNDIAMDVILKPFEFGKCLCNEIDTEEDLMMVSQKVKEIGDYESALY